MKRFRWMLWVLPLGLAAVLAVGTWFGWVSWTRIYWIDRDPLDGATRIDHVEPDGTIVLVTGERLWVVDATDDLGVYLAVSLAGCVCVDGVLSQTDGRAEIQRLGRIPDGRIRARVWVAAKADWRRAPVTIPLRVRFLERWRRSGLFRYTGSRC
jgi:hypothetical protein